MMQNYDFYQDFGSASTNTSMESVSIEHPSQQAIEYIKAFARCIQTVEMEEMEIHICLN